MRWCRLELRRWTEQLDRKVVSFSHTGTLGTKLDEEVKFTS